MPVFWIDSLCIIQDSTEDWEKEAGRMASVYGETHINIAATGAIDGNVGLFLKHANTVGGACFPSSSPNLPTYAVVHPGLYRDGISNTVLSSRAWAFQERVLSSRTLHFGFGDLFWECHTKDACEFFPNGIPPPFTTYDAIGRRSELVSARWSMITELYSKCYMTNSRDKLVALAGVARMAQQESGEDYIAGMWRTRMEELLL